MSVAAGTAALRLALRRLLVAAAAVAVLGHGGVELAPRLLAAGASVAAVPGDTPSSGRPTAARPAADSQPVPAASTMRLALAVSVPVGSADPAAGPGSSPLLAPHLVARPVVRPPTPSHLRAARGGASGRGPPASAGT